MSKNFQSTTFMLLSTFSLSFTGLLAKYLSQAMPIELLGFLRFAVPAAMLFVVLFFIRLRSFPLTAYKPLLVRGICISACQVCFLLSLQRLTLVESIVLFSSGPLFIPVLEKLIFGARISVITIIGLVMTFVGVLCMAGDLSQFELKPELLVGLLAGVFNSGSQLSLYRSTKGDVTPIELNAWTFVIASSLLLPFVILSATVGDLQVQALFTGHLSTAVVGALMVMSVLIINTQIFRAKAYKLADSGSQLAPLIFTNLLFTALWQYSFFDDVFTVSQIVGISLIVSASVMNTFLPKMLRRKAISSEAIKTA
ncbi:DMT family transporter [Vibrio makurazakiensis]|uniref:DMT family transporter n=1 Tax=Vibrio makurazakiensis TaxID=2910250 RepID=UPI003D11B807